MILAVILLVGFYAIALGIAGALLFGIYAQLLYWEGISLRLTFVLLVGAGAILYAIFPRSDKFEPPWPRLTAADQPRLFDKLLELATATRQEIPKEVYLLPDVNAWVMDRGGRMGIGSRRVMGIGLPLLQVLNISELDAVLAHEFGHYYAGDTKLGPWIYKTRMTIGFTLETLERTNRFLKVPFTLYGKMYLRTTQAVSRRQEILADEFAARTAGAENLSNALKKIHGHAQGHVYYWNEYVAPVLGAKYRPHISEGYARFIASTPTADMVARVIQQELTDGERNPYGSHPTLRERVDAIEMVPVESGDDDSPAITLLDDIDALEEQLIHTTTTEEVTHSLEPIEWENIGAEVFIPTWKRWYDVNKTAVEGWTPKTLPQAADRLGELARRLKSPNGQRIPPEHGPPAAAYSLSVGFAMALLENGWELMSCPGEGIYFFKGTFKLDPFSLVKAISASATVDPSEWNKQCVEMDIQDIDFGGKTESP